MPSEAKENALSSVIADETDGKVLFAWLKRDLNLQVLILETAKFLNQTSDRLPSALPSINGHYYQSPSLFIFASNVTMRGGLLSRPLTEEATSQAPPLCPSRSLVMCRDPLRNND